ncbi:hypothetical protein MAQA_11871 [Listeria aquatica FSL S10-1188]|uniref:Uncharacterized protein n=1 Tax=Listeria aquatica FSL S10-1188 TaxID=1265818 RepID=W7B4N7_9LIST|nr:hypothetical protein MAQA_11871 [Listeria aquatica FSL S10-1188]
MILLFITVVSQQFAKAKKKQFEFIADAKTGTIIDIYLT